MPARRSVGAVLNSVLRAGGSRRRAALVTPAGGVESAAKPRCASPCLFERKKGGPRCKFCGNTPWHLPARGAHRVRGARSRDCAPEKDVQQAVIRLFTMIGCRYDKTGKDADIYVLGTRRPRHLAAAAHRTHQTPGISDLYVFLPKPRWQVTWLPVPTAVWVEVKADDGSPSDAQVAFEARCASHQVAHVMGGVDAVTAFLKQFGFLKGGA